MENASKALLITGGVLFAIMVTLLGATLVSYFKTATDSYVTQLDATELQKYNSNFEIYIDRNDITAQEIVTVASIAREKNSGTKVYIDSVEVTEGDAQAFELWKYKFLKENILTHSKDNAGVEQVTHSYSYVSISYDAEGKVSQIVLEKN